MPTSERKLSTREPMPTQWLAGTAAAVLWSLALVGAILDITDQFPQGLVLVAAVAAGTVTVVAVHLHVAHDLAALTAQQEQLSAKIGDFWQGYTAAVSDVNGVTSLDEKRRSPS